MRLNSTARMAVTLNTKIRNKFGDKVRDFLISNVCDDNKKRSFST